jgi:hypothetical protein
MPEQRDDITAAMHDVQDQYHVVRHDAVDDDVIVGRKAAQARPQIFVTATAHVRYRASDQKRSVMPSTTRVAISVLPLSRAM